MKPVVFKDKVKVTVAAGNGGDGVASFRREKFVPRGGPDGGDGGRGGHVVLQASKDVDSLLPLYFNPLQRAGHGKRGLGKRQHGRNGEDLYVKVPCGTEVRLWDSKEWVAELIEDGDELRIAKGGQGGLGNCHFSTSTHQAPTKQIDGEKGEEIAVQMEMKMIADVGLVGYPNAGKSTILCAISEAHPKTASYPFTTLHPMLGTLQYEDYTRIKVADIPGLIDGAHKGVGLGHDFLRHIERTRFLIFVIDMGAVDGRSPTVDFRNLRQEITLYQEEIGNRPYMVVANKMDVPGSTERLHEFREETEEDPLEMCAEIGEGAEELRAALYDRIHGRL